MRFSPRLLAALILPFGFAASAVSATSPDPIAAAGTYRLTVRQCDGPLASIYDAGTSANVTIAGTGDVTIGQQASLAARMDPSGSWLSNDHDTVTESAGRFAGVTVTKEISIKVVNGAAVGGVIKYVLSEDGRTKSGTIVFSLARTG